MRHYLPFFPDVNIIPLEQHLSPWKGASQQRWNPRAMAWVNEICIVYKLISEQRSGALFQNMDSNGVFPESQ